MTVEHENFSYGICHAETDGIDITIHGHTPLEFPQWVKNRYFMDTGAWYSDVLTLRNIEDIYNEHNYKHSVFG